MAVDALPTADALNAERLAVRSSAIMEDLPGASFTGQYESVMNIPADSTTVLGAVGTVGRGATTDRVVAYRDAHDGAVEDEHLRE